MYTQNQPFDNGNKYTLSDNVVVPATFEQLNAELSVLCKDDSFFSTVSVNDDVIITEYLAIFELGGVVYINHRTYDSVAPCYLGRNNADGTPQGYSIEGDPEVHAIVTVLSAYANLDSLDEKSVWWLSCLSDSDLIALRRFLPQRVIARFYLLRCQYA